MAGEVFDLSRVLQSAEQIKAARRQPAEDLLKSRYLESQIANNAQSGQLAAAQEERAKVTAAAAAAKAGQDKTSFSVEAAGQIGALAKQALASPDPRAAVQSAFQNPTYQDLFKAVGLDPASVNLDDPALPQHLQTWASFVPPDKAKGNPSSYDEFALAQKDPEFAKFLQARKGKGISMTMPDGTTLNIGGDGGTVAPQDLSNPTKNKLQDAIVQSTDELDRLNSVGSGFDPKFLQIPGRLKGATLRLKDLAGVDLNPDEQAYLTKFSGFKADAAKNLSTILNRLSGAAISPAEGERLKKGIPNDEDSPTQFIAKYRAAVKDSTRAIMRANWALKNGIGVKSVEDLSKSMPLNSIDHVFEDRANEIWQGLGGTPETKQNAITQANREFGVAR
jgi:hypothetical protein